MGYFTLFTECVACRTSLMCNPHKVPSIRVNGVNEPVCASCVARWNTLHPEKTFIIPEGAYEPANEGEDLGESLHTYLEPNTFDSNVECNDEYYHDFDDKDEDNE